MVSIRLLISESSSPCTSPLVTVQSAPITIDITVTFIFHGFSVLKQGLGNYLSFHFLLILLCGLPGRQSPQFGRFSFCWLSLGLVVYPRLGDLLVSQIHIIIIIDKIRMA